MTQPLRVRRLTNDEGRRIKRIVRRSGGKSDESIVKWRRVPVTQASAGGNTTVPAIARLVSTSEDRVREVVHRFNEHGMRSLDPQWAGGRPRQITTHDVMFIVPTARQRPEALGPPFPRCSIRNLVDYLADNDGWTDGWMVSIQAKGVTGALRLRLITVRLQPLTRRSLESLRSQRERR